MKVMLSSEDKIPAVRKKKPENLKLPRGNHLLTSAHKNNNGIESFKKLANFRFPENFAVENVPNKKCTIPSLNLMTDA